MQYNFFNDLERGKPGEQIFVRVAEELGYKVDDLSDDKHYQKKGVDFRINDTNRSLLVDVKTDYRMHKTGNIFLELADGPREGWARKTKADLIFYIDYYNDVAYVLDWNTAASVMGQLRTVNFPNQDGVWMCGALLSVSSMNDLGVRNQVIDL